MIGNRITFRLMVGAYLFTSMHHVVVFPATSFARHLQTIHDGRLLSDDTEIPAAENKRFADAILDRLPPKSWADYGIACESTKEQFLIIDCTEGRFTNPQVNQRAVLFTFCQPGHNYGENGIAVFENDRLKDLAIYSGGWENDIEAIPDLDGNGCMELAIETGGVNFGEVWGTISIIGLTSDGVRSFGRISTLDDDCENPSGGKGGETVEIAIRSEPEPVFYRRTFRQSCTKGAKWQPAGDWQRFVPQEEDGDNYQRIMEDSP